MANHFKLSEKYKDDTEPIVLVNENGAMFWYARNWYPSPDRLYDSLLHKIKWEKRTGELYGKIYEIPRLMYHMGDPVIEKYTEYVFQPWHPVLEKIRNILQDSFGCYLDSCLLNYYPDGCSYISQHSDRENKGLRRITIGVVFGATRDFVLVRKSDGHRIVFENKAGDLYVMQGTMQEYWKHGIPKRKKLANGRISATFRQLLPDEYHIRKNKINIGK